MEPNAYKFAFSLAGNNRTSYFSSTKPIRQTPNNKFQRVAKFADLTSAFVHKLQISCVFLNLKLSSSGLPSRFHLVFSFYRSFITNLANGILFFETTTIYFIFFGSNVYGNLQLFDFL